jgi:hypothetical protein
MSHDLTSIIACPDIQDQLNQHFLTQANPLDAREKQDFTDVFVNSALNTNGILQSKVSPGRGKRRTVELIYTPPILESEIGTTPAKACTSSNEAGMLSESYELADDEGVNYDEKFDLLNMATMCQDNALWFAGRIQAIMDGLTKKMGTINATQLALLHGNFGSGESNVNTKIKTIATRTATALGAGPDMSGWSDIVKAAENAGYPGAPFVFGWGEIYDYVTKVKAGCCANAGIDIAAFAAQNDLVFLKDKKIGSALNTATNQFLTLAPGAVQLLTWLEFEGERGINVIDSEVYKQTVITDPRTGFRFDLQVKNDCGSIYVNIKLAHKLVGMPTDMFSAGDAFDGVTFVNKFAISNPA